MAAAPRETDGKAELRETHSAVVALVGDHAYKAKKGVDLGFLDFTSAEARDQALRRELELNRRICNDVYLDVAQLVGSDGAHLESVLIMRRMPDERRLSTLLGAGGADTTELQRHLRSVARRLAEFHARAEHGAQISAEAGQIGLRRRWTDNLAEMRRFVGASVDRELYRRIAALALAFIDGREPLFDRRRDAQLYVDGHGDVTAEDTFCLDDGPRILDCLEFDDRLRWLDALDDAAFLAMELEHLGRPGLARYFLDAYAQFSAVPNVPSLEHHYIAYRALVRAKIACLRAEQRGESADQDAVDAYLQLALRHLEAGQVRLLLVGGAPGTGKSTIAELLADTLGAVLLATDAVRREIAPDPPRYDDESRLQIYRALLVRAERALANGETVVADATWESDELRRLARRCAEATASEVLEFECHAPPALAAARAERRVRRGLGRSQAGGAVALMLAGRRDAWPTATAVDCSGSPREAMRSIAYVLAYGVR
ncbi:MAG TPA: AAA family ATPase [Jatrophihabitans sp.]|jgi:hypothetical protein